MRTIAIAANLHTAFGQAEAFNYRHWRNRNTTKAERPCCAFRIVNIELDDSNQQVHTQSEICWKMTVDVVLDFALAPELDVGGDDPTGWNMLAGTANAISNLYLSPTSDLLSIVDDVLPGDTDPDEDSTPDDGRLAQSIVVLYRTLRSDLNYLLNSEENAP
jgi:hypothetical protein